MTRLIEDVLDFAQSRLGTGMVLKAAHDDSLESALREVVTELCESHPSRAVVDDIAIDQPVFVDRARLQQLLSNLLGNALHHGATDQPIQVRASLSRGALEIEVVNGGPPIGPEHLQKIFEPYWRAPTSRADGGPGAAPPHLQNDRQGPRGLARSRLDVGRRHPLHRENPGTR